MKITAGRPRRSQGREADKRQSRRLDRHCPILQLLNDLRLVHSGHLVNDGNHHFSLSKDIETIGETYSIDVALLNIGGHFGMEPKMAAKAAQSVRARLAVPHHFGTFPGIAQTADGFAAELKKLKIAFYEMKPGETISFRGKQLVKK